MTRRGKGYFRNAESLPVQHFPTASFLNFQQHFLPAGRKHFHKVGMSREDRISELKQRMVAKYGSCLLPIQENAFNFQEPKEGDTPEEKAMKQQKKREARETAYRQKVPEMMLELDKLIERVKSARPELVKTGMENVYSTGTAALTVFNLMCEQCGNRVSFYSH